MELLHNPLLGPLCVIGRLMVHRVVGGQTEAVVKLHRMSSHAIQCVKVLRNEPLAARSYSESHLERKMFFWGRDLIFYPNSERMIIPVSPRGPVPYKPMSTKEFEKYLQMVRWHIEKGSIDWKLYDEEQQFVCAILISHGSRTKSEVTANSVQKTKKAFKERGMLWPPKKRSTKS